MPPPAGTSSATVADPPPTLPRPAPPVIASDGPAVPVNGAERSDDRALSDPTTFARRAALGWAALAGWAAFATGATSEVSLAMGGGGAARGMSSVATGGGVGIDGGAGSSARGSTTGTRADVAGLSDARGP